MYKRRRWARGATLMTLCAVGALGCLKVAEERAILEERVGRATQEGLSFYVEEGASSIRSIHRQAAHVSVDLWAQQPAQRLTIQRAPHVQLEEPPQELTVTWHNLMAGSQVTLQSESGEPLPFERLSLEGEPVTRFTLNAPLSAGGLSWVVSPPEPESGERLYVGVFADVQERIAGLAELLRPLAEEPVQFCLISGDLTAQGATHELREFQGGLERHLPFPCYATMGNHELGTAGPPFYQFFGRGSFSFSYGGARVTLLDDASATIAPRTLSKLKGWLNAGRDQLHILVTHLPILDMDGTRSGAFASRLEAMELLASLAASGVDLLLYGHVHTFKAYRQAGIPALISGGGGSIPMRFDGVGRHYLVLELDPIRQQLSYRVREVSPEE